MAILLVPYDLRKPGRSYQPVYDYLEGTFTYCKGMASVWLLDTARRPADMRDALKRLVDANDRVFVACLNGARAAFHYPCGNWLNEPTRSW